MDRAKFCKELRLLNEKLQRKKSGKEIKEAIGIIEKFVTMNEHLEGEKEEDRENILFLKKSVKGFQTYDMSRRSFNEVILNVIFRMKNIR